jgi:hypothetical protein
MNSVVLPIIIITKINIIIVGGAYFIVVSLGLQKSIVFLAMNLHSSCFLIFLQSHNFHFSSSSSSSFFFFFVFFFSQINVKAYKACSMSSYSRAVFKSLFGKASIFLRPAGL